MQPKFSKKQSKELRRLADAAFDRELTRALEGLEAQFRSWRAGEISPHDLNHEIHKFHDGVSHDLWKMYANLEPHFAVARAIAKGLTKETELSPEVRSQLAPVIVFMREDRPKSESEIKKQE